MTEVSVCGLCGAVSRAGVSFCFACGGSLTSNGQAGVPPVPPPTQLPPPQFAPPPFAQFAPPQSPVPAAVQPWYGAAGPYGTPPPGYNAAGPVPNAAARSTGIAVLAIVEIAVAVGGLLVTIDLLGWANWRFAYDDFGWGVLDLAIGLAYLGASVIGFQVAQGLWRLQPWMWKRACTLSLFLLGMEFVSVFVWGLTGQDVVGVIVHLSVLAYLSSSSVRVLFGRSPTTLFEGPR